MADAWGKIPSGILMGNTYELGNYDQCIGIEYESQQSGKIQGQYCLAGVVLASDLLPKKNTSFLTRTGLPADVERYLETTNSLKIV